MTNREKLLLYLGDSMIAQRLIETRHYYQTNEDLDNHNWHHTSYISHRKEYDNYDDAFSALKKWLDKEAKPSKTKGLDDDINCGTIVIPRPSKAEKRLEK